MSQWFTSLNAFMRDDESLIFQISRKGAHLIVVVCPKLGDPPSNLPAHAAQARAALAFPVRLEGPPESIDEKFERYLRGIGEKRAEIGDGYDAQLRELNEAAKAAKQRAASSASRASKPAAPPATTGASAKPAETDAKDQAPPAETTKAAAGDAAAAPKADPMNNSLSLF